MPSPDRRVIVSLHDAAPPFEDAIRAQLAALAAVGVHRCVLKVVPLWHGAHPIDQAGSFRDLLRAQVDAGSQLVLHGLEHRPHGPLRGTPLTWTRGMLFARGAAEFLSLDSSAAEDALRRGRALFARAGLPEPLAFCAPGWLLNAAGAEAVARAGLRQLIGMFTVTNLTTGRRTRLPGFGYMGGGPAQEAGVRILNGMVRSAALPRARVAKVYLHPQHALGNPAHDRVLASIRRMVAAGWRPATYAEVFDDR